MPVLCGGDQPCKIRGCFPRNVNAVGWGVSLEEAPGGTEWQRQARLWFDAAEHSRRSSPLAGRASCPGCCSWVTQLCLTVRDPRDCSTPGSPVLHHLQECVQTQVRGVSAAIQPSHPLSPPSPPTLTLSQCRGLFQWFGSAHQVARALELQF